MTCHLAMIDTGRLPRSIVDIIMGGKHEARRLKENIKHTGGRPQPDIDISDDGFNTTADTSGADGPMPQSNTA